MLRIELNTGDVRKGRRARHLAVDAAMVSDVLHTGLGGCETVWRRSEVKHIEILGDIKLSYYHHGNF